MHYAHLTNEVRQQTRRRLEALGAGADSELIETILIRDGFYCGRRFECDGLSAVWFVEEKQVKLYQRDGSVLTSCSINDFLNPNQQRRQAA